LLAPTASGGDGAGPRGVYVHGLRLLGSYNENIT
jgi:hypothetical protein